MWSQVIDDVRFVEEPSYEELAEKNQKLEKALDKACEVLSDCAKMQCEQCPKYKEQGKYLCDICYYDTLNKDQWKELVKQNFKEGGKR